MIPSSALSEVLVTHVASGFTQHVDFRREVMFTYSMYIVDSACVQLLSTLNALCAPSSHTPAQLLIGGGQTLVWLQARPRVDYERGLPSRLERRHHTDLSGVHPRLRSLASVGEWVFLTDEVVFI